MWDRGVRLLENDERRRRVGAIEATHFRNCNVQLGRREIIEWLARIVGVRLSFGLCLPKLFHRRYARQELSGSRRPGGFGMWKRFGWAIQFDQRDGQGVLSFRNIRL